MESDHHDWPLASLESITSKIGSGATPRGGKQSYKSEGISLIRSLNVYDFEFAYDDLAFIDDEQAAGLSNVEIEPADVLINITGASVARCCLVPENVLPARVNQHVAIIRVLPSEADARYVQYCLASPRYKRHLLGIASGGATRKALTKSTLEDYQIPLPPLPVQRRIAGVLTAYDDLIENNARRIDLLEDMAQAVHREWFVELRFPGHADAQMRETEALGAVPAGWRVARLGDLAESPRNRVKPQEEIEPDVPYFGLGDLPKESIALAEWGRAEDAGSTKYTFNRGDILFGKIRPYFHKAGPAPVAGICSTDAIVIRPFEPEHFGLVLGCVSSEEFVAHATQTSSGTKMPRAKWKILEDYPVAVPPAPLLEQFDETMRAFVDQIHTLIHKNRTLRRTRDLLLPRLVSGEVAVGKIEKEKVPA